MGSPAYDTIGRGYVAHRRPDPRWEAVVAEHLAAPAGGLVVNVGAGHGLVRTDALRGRRRGTVVRDGGAAAP